MHGQCLAAMPCCNSCLALPQALHVAAEEGHAEADSATRTWYGVRVCRFPQNTGRKRGGQQGGIRTPAGFLHSTVVRSASERSERVASARPQEVIVSLLRTDVWPTLPGDFGLLLGDFDVGRLQPTSSSAFEPCWPTSERIRSISGELDQFRRDVVEAPERLLKVPVGGPWTSLTPP